MEVCLYSLGVMKTSLCELWGVMGVILIVVDKAIVRGPLGTNKQYSF